MPAAITFLIPMLIPLILGLPSFKADKADEYEQNHTTWVYPPWEHTWGVVRATEAHLDFFTFGKATFRNPQGLAVVRLTATDDPDEVNDDDEVTVYGVNSGENAVIYNKSMHSIGLYGYGGKSVGMLSAPWDIDALPNGLVFVTDSGHKRVVKYRNIGGELVYQSEFGKRGPGALQLPRGIDVTAGGFVVVADAGAGRVAIYDTSGVFLRAVSGFDRPVGLAAVDSTEEFTRPERTYFAVTDSGGRRLRKVDFNGRVLAERDISEFAGVGGTYGGHVEIDLYHNLIVTDSANARILKLDDKLNPLNAWGQAGEGRTRFHGPTGIAIWRRFGQTFVAEAKGAHYLWVGVDVQGPPHLDLTTPGVLMVTLALTERASIQLELVNHGGEVVRTHSTYSDTGEHTVRWRYNQSYFTRPDSLSRPQVVHPEPLPAGDYSLRIRLRATYSSRIAFEKVMETSVNLGADSGGK